MTCPECESGKLRATEVPHSVEVAGRTYRGRVQGEKCDRCGHVYLGGASALSFEREVANRVADEGPITGEGLRFLRTVLMMQADQLAHLLDVRPETISRWENDRAPIDRNAWLVVGDLVADAVAGGERTRERIAALGAASKRATAKESRRVPASRVTSLRSRKSVGTTGGKKRGVRAARGSKVN